MLVQRTNEFCHEILMGILRGSVILSRREKQSSDRGGDLPQIILEMSRTRIQMQMFDFKALNSRCTAILSASYIS